MAAWGLAGAILVLAPARGESVPAGLIRGATITVADVLDGETARLADGSSVRLAAIMAPATASPRPGQSQRADPVLARLQMAARDALAKLVEGQPITLHYAGAPRRDRHGRHVAYVALPTDDWVQATLVSQGHARVNITSDASLGAAVLLGLEAAARDQRLGLWRHEAFRVRSPRELGRWLDTFQLVEGTTTISDGARPANRLAVEADGSRLALILSTRARSEFRALGDFDNRPVRVRGWVRWQNGPVMDITHGAAIEPLGPR